MMDIHDIEEPERKLRENLDTFIRTVVEPSTMRTGPIYNGLRTILSVHEYDRIALRTKKHFKRKGMRDDV